MRPGGTASKVASAVVVTDPSGTGTSREKCSVVAYFGSFVSYHRNSPPTQCACALTCNGIPFQSSQMRSFVLGIAAGAIVTIAIVHLVPSRSTPVARESRPATPESVCGRNTFNILVEVARFPVPGHEEQFLAALEKRQQALADGLRGQLDRAGLRHDLACPAILSVFGVLNEDSRGRWTVSARVGAHTTTRSAMAYPTWDSDMYKVSWNNLVEAQADLERSLVERVQRFLMYFGQPEDGRVAIPLSRSGRP